MKGTSNNIFLHLNTINKQLSIKVYNKKVYEHLQKLINKGK